MRGVLLPAAVAALALWLGACTHDIPSPGLIPTSPPVAHVEDLTGEYCYYGPDFNVRSFGRPVDGIPFIHVRDLGTPTLVSVKATAERIVFRYTAADGGEREQVFDVARSGAVWERTSLAVKHSFDPMLPLPAGFNVYSLESELFRLTDGRLVMTNSDSEKGVGHGSAYPFIHKERTVAVILDPANGGCDAGTTGRPRQPWFDLGMDLREPACAAELEEQIASILVQKKVEPEAAALAAGNTLESLIRGAPTLEFSTSPGPDKRYLFKVVKKRSGCVLKLYSFVGRPVSHGSYASRPLSACVCND